MVSVLPSGLVTSTAQRPVAFVVGHGVDASCSTGSAVRGRAPPGPGGSTRGARGAARSTRSSGRRVRTSSSRSGCRCRRARPGSGSPTTCRPGPPFFSITVNGRFACASRSAASSPDSPQPMTTTCESARTSSGISSAQVIARASAPSRCRSSRNIGTTSSSSGAVARNAIISRDELGGRRRREHAPAVAEREDRRQRPRARRGLLLLRHAARVVVEHRRPGPQLAADPLRVAGDVHHRAQQRGDAQVVERGGDDGVVVGERTTRVWVVRTRPWPEDTTLAGATPVGDTDLSNSGEREAECISSHGVVGWARAISPAHSPGRSVSPSRCARSRDVRSTAWGSVLSPDAGLIVWSMWAEHLGELERPATS